MTAWVERATGCGSARSGSSVTNETWSHFFVGVGIRFAPRAWPGAAAEDGPRLRFGFRDSGLRSLLNPRSVAGQVFFLQVVVVVLLVAAPVTVLVLQVERDSTREAQHRSVSAAEMFASAPGVAQAVDSPDPTAMLQPRAEAARKRAGVD